MNRRRPALLIPVVLLLSLVFTLPAAADVPDKFTNLQVLPKDIGKRELVDMMREYSIALGVRCTHCHVEQVNAAGEEEEDFASDEKEPKRVARAMMRMTGDINGKLLPASGRKDLVRVRCVTCHRGLANPATIDQVMLATIDEAGVATAIQKYGELRDEHAEDGAYDFSSGPLGHVAETLAGRDDAAGALAVARANVEFHPESARALVLLGQLQAQGGDRDGAIATLEKALILEPENRWVQRLLGQLKPN